MRMSLISSAEYPTTENGDIGWVRTVALKGVDHIPDFESALIDGNDDCPDRVTLYDTPDPRHDTDPLIVYWRCASGNLVPLPSTEARLTLVGEVFQAMYDNTESFHDDPSLAVGFLYLAGCIAKSTWSSYEEPLDMSEVSWIRFLIEHFKPDHIVWNYVELVPHEGLATGMRFTSVRGDSDLDYKNQERSTPPGSVGKVHNVYDDHIDLVFENGVWVCPTIAEMNDETHYVKVTS